MSSRRNLFLTVLLLAAILVGALQTLAQEPVEINWITDFPNATDVAARFMELHPDIQVRVDSVSFREVFQQNQVRLGSGSAQPDIVMVDAPLVASYGLRGWLLPLDEYFDEAQVDNWVDGQYQAGIYNDQLLAPPTINSTQVMFVNNDLFEAAGITPPGPEDRWTWEQVTEAAIAITEDVDSDGVNDVWGLQFDQVNRIYQLQPLAQSLPGAQVIGDDGLSVKGIIDGPEWVKGFTWFYDLHNTWKVAPQGDISGWELFNQGKLAMFVGGAWFIPGLIGEPPAFNWSAAPHPYWEGGEVMVPGDSWHVGVNPNSEHIAEAVELMKFLTSAEGGQMWYDLWGAWPAHESMLDAIVNDPANADWPGRAFGVAANESLFMQPRPLTPGYLEYEEILSDTFEDIRNGADPQEALSLAADRIEREMRKYR